MGMKDQVIERRLVQWMCDTCNVVEVKAYDSGNLYFDPVEFDHDWRTFPMYPLDGEKQQAFCSRECLEKSQRADADRAYGQRTLT